MWWLLLDDDGCLLPDANWIWTFHRVFDPALWAGFLKFIFPIRSRKIDKPFLHVLIVEIRHLAAAIRKVREGAWTNDVLDTQKRLWASFTRLHRSLQVKIISSILTWKKKKKKYHIPPCYHHNNNFFFHVIVHPKKLTKDIYPSGVAQDGQGGEMCTTKNRVYIDGAGAVVLSSTGSCKTSRYYRSRQPASFREKRELKNLLLLLLLVDGVLHTHKVAKGGWKEGEKK